MDDAQGFWSLLIPHGLSGGALRHLISEEDDEDEDEAMATDEEGWQPEYTEWWFEFLREKGGRGISKDTWQMVCTLFSSFLGLQPDFILTLVVLGVPSSYRLEI